RRRRRLRGARPFRAHLPPPPPLPDHRGLRRDPAPQDRRTPVRLHGPGTQRGMTEHEVFQHTLEAAIRRHLGAPGEVRALVRLTGGATKLTWSFDALVRTHNLTLILHPTPTDP